MRIYKGTLIIQLPRLNWQTKLLQKLGCKLHYFRLYKTVSFDMYAWSKVISIYRKRENEFYLSMQTTIVALLHIYVLYVRPFCVTVNQKDMLYKCKGGGYCKIYYYYVPSTSGHPSWLPYIFNTSTTSIFIFLKHCFAWVRKN